MATKKPKITPEEQELIDRFPKEVHATCEKSDDKDGYIYFNVFENEEDAVNDSPIVAVYRLASVSRVTRKREYNYEKLK